CPFPEGKFARLGPRLLCLCRVPPVPVPGDRFTLLSQEEPAPSLLKFTLLLLGDHHDIGLVVNGHTRRLIAVLMWCQVARHPFAHVDGVARGRDDVATASAIGTISSTHFSTPDCRARAYDSRSLGGHRLGKKFPPARGALHD